MQLKILVNPTVGMLLDIQLRNEMMVIKMMVMDVMNIELLKTDMLVLEDQLQHQIIAFFVHQLEEVYQLIKEVENLGEEMDSNKNLSNEKMVM